MRVKMKLNKLLKSVKTRDSDMQQALDVNHIFKDSYEYTRQYWKFRRDKENNEKV